MAQLHDRTFPNETPEYREARNKLLKAEIELRRANEAVNAQRRELPLGGEVPEDYVFHEGEPARAVKMSDLFASGEDTLIVYSFMYGPEMDQPCPACTSIIDSLQGAAPHAEQRVNLVVVAKSPIERILEFARSRNWNNVRLLSSAGNTYNTDYFGESEQGDQQPVLNVFTRRVGDIYHSYSTELFFTPSEPGQNSRHVDSIWPMWSLFDFTPEGRGDFHPSLSYDKPIKLGRG